MKYVTMIGELYQFTNRDYEEWLLLGAETAPGEARDRIHEFSKHIGRREAEVIDWCSEDFAAHLEELTHAR